MANSTTAIGFDFGTKRIGIAVGQTITKTATPLTTLRNINNQPDWQKINEIIQEWQPNLIIIGLPLLADGKTGTSGKAAKKFAESMKTRFEIPVQLHDERLTSVTAKSLLLENQATKKNKKQKQELDEFAAALIIQSWLSEQ